MDKHTFILILSNISVSENGASIKTRHDCHELKVSIIEETKVKEEEENK